MIENKYKITHFIWSLEIGGAEMLLYNLLSKTDKNSFTSEVIVMKEAGPVGAMIKKLDVPVLSMGSRRGIQLLTAYSKLIVRLKRNPPDLIQTWMYVSDIAGLTAAKFAGAGTPVVWSAHNPASGPQNENVIAANSIKICAKLAKSRHAPSKIICCSTTTKRMHIAQGYPNNDKMIVIDNGVDTERFKPDAEARGALRKEIGVGDGDLLIGMVARYHPQKDHANFLRAASILIKKEPNAYFLLCGDQIDSDNDELAAMIKAGGLKDRCRLLGVRMDTPAIQASLDIGCLSSIGESFPLAIAEAMSCGVPCVATDAPDGALAHLIGDTGITASPGDSVALSQAWLRLIEMGVNERQNLGTAARERIVNNFSLKFTVDKYENTYRNVIENIRIH